MSYWYSERTLCECLEDMRRCIKTANYGPLPSLVEEAQMMGERMENGLEAIKADVGLPKRVAVLQKQVNKLYDEKQKLEDEIDTLKEQKELENGRTDAGA